MKPAKEVKPENLDQTSQRLMGWATSLLKLPGKESRSAPGFGHSAGFSQLWRKMDLAAEFNRTSSVSNREGLVLVENRKRITVVLAERSAHAAHTLASRQQQQVGGRSTASQSLGTKNSSPWKKSQQRGRASLHALGYSVGSRGRGRTGSGFTNLPVGTRRREPPRLLSRCHPALGVA